MQRRSLVAWMPMFVSASVATAHADRGIAVSIGAGATHDRYSIYEYGRSRQENRWGPGVDLDVTYRVLGELSLGVHFAAARSYQQFTCPVERGGHTNHYTTTPALFGFTATYTIFDRVWLAPWIGALDIETRYTHSSGPPPLDTFCLPGSDSVERRFAYGIGLGGDLWIDKRHRLGPFVQLARAREEVEIDSYPDHFKENIVLSFGVAYRYW